MKTSDNILSFRIDIPKSELSIFEFLAKRMGWKIHSKLLKEEDINCEKRQESKLFFENSKRSMAQHLQKYLSE